MKKMQFIICPSVKIEPRSSNMSDIHFTTAPRKLFPLAVQVCFIPNITTEDYPYWYGGKLEPGPAKGCRPLINLEVLIWRISSLLNAKLSLQLASVDAQSVLCLHPGLKPGRQIFS